MEQWLRYWAGGTPLQLYTTPFCYLSAVRYSWSAMFLPILYIVFGKRRPAMVIIGTILLVLSSIAKGMWWAAPFPRYTLWADMMEPAI